MVNTKMRTLLEVPLRIRLKEIRVDNPLKVTSIRQRRGKRTVLVVSSPRVPTILVPTIPTVLGIRKVPTILVPRVPRIRVSTILVISKVTFSEKRFCFVYKLFVLVRIFMTISKVVLVKET